MRCLIVKPGKLPKEIVVENLLEALQDEVEGYVEFVPLSDDAVMIVNEEGKLRGMPVNRWLIGPDGRLCDVIRGNIVIVGVKGENLCGLTDTQAKCFADMFGSAAVSPWRDDAQ